MGSVTRRISRNRARNEDGKNQGRGRTHQSGKYNGRRKGPAHKSNSGAAHESGVGYSEMPGMAGLLAKLMSIPRSHRGER